MKTFQFVLVLTFAGFISFPFLQAQEIVTLDTRQQPKTEPTNVVKKPTFDRSLGQQTAYFENFETYTTAHLTYPEIAQEHNIEGTVSILIEISPEGIITKSKIVDSLGFGCDEAALKLVANMPKWTPAMNYGVPVKSKQLLQFNFSLR